MFTLRQLTEGRVTQSIDSFINHDKPFRLIYTLYSEDHADRVYAFMRYHNLTRYRPMNFGRIRDIYEFIRLSSIMRTSRFDGSIKDFRIVELTDGVYRPIEILEYTDRYNQVVYYDYELIDTEEEDSEDSDSSDNANSNLVWLVYDRVALPGDWFYCNHRDNAYLIGIRSAHKNNRSTYVCGMSQDMAEAIIAGEIDPEFDFQFQV